MKVNIGVFAHNSKDWERLQSGDYSRPPAAPDYEFIQRALALADLAEPLGFDGIWAPEHQGTPYGMTPNPIQTLTYFAGRTKRISLGTMVVVTPWWSSTCPLSVVGRASLPAARIAGRDATLPSC